MTQSAADIAKMPFEAALAELESIVDKLEKGAVALEDSIKLYERGEALKAHCDQLLKNAEMRIEKIALSAPTASPKALRRWTASKTNRREADKIVRLTLLVRWKRGNFRHAPIFGHTLLTITGRKHLERC